MHDYIKRVSPLSLIVAVAAGACVLSGIAYAQIYSLSASATRTASSTDERIVTLEQKVVALSDALYATEQSLEAVRNRVGGFEDTVGSITSTVGTLEKLSKTDPQLLQKYSKVYFLNENYVPERLDQVPQEYVYSNTRPERFLLQVEPHLLKMMDDAKKDGIDLFIVSAYRSFDEQKALKSAYSVTYGAGTANQFSADQGYSEHQLGTAVDFTTSGRNGALDGFDQTDAYRWLQKNAYKYGFELSYPQGNSYYVFEPWHWRFVGVQLTKDLHDEKKNFYDLEQRDIDEYLIDFFD